LCVRDWLKEAESKRAVSRSTNPPIKPKKTHHKTKQKKAPLLETYAGHLRSVIIEAVDHPSSRARPLEGLKIVVDAGNGSGGFFAEQVCVCVCV
jgi:phosphomannomutase